MIQDDNYQLFIDNESALVYADKQYISDEQARNFALKLNTDGKLIVIDLQELARQTHFRGYYLLNADIINLTYNAAGDFAFSAESGTVQMYKSAWYDSGQLVPDQVTPASDATPLEDSGAGSAGISTLYSRGDHVHPQQLTYDNDITATKFIKTGGTNQQILMADGTNKQITDFNPNVAQKEYQFQPTNSMDQQCFAVFYNTGLNICSAIWMYY
ncbi:MAG: hypothetical protein EZS28_045897 [Streblomastix strix]|uniref:Uncharacterized protein n=1 Tax=Streblomastix strix TaxID=222440 RepID=A0A5J4TJE4_9EUKA|nr:MAG: hypothetical protein EZS28_045897 [Streblomastix strix]